jgi:hypothetical protein
MEMRVPDETAIRDYLLGRLDDYSEVAERMDELMLTNAEFFDSLGVIEDEIIEEYLEGSLSAADRQSAETHFLRPPERRRKLQIARLLSRRLATAAGASQGEGREEGIARLPGVRELTAPRLSFRLCGEIAAAILLTASVAYLVQSRRDFQATIRDSSQKLAQEQARSAILDQRLQSARELAQPAVVMLSLSQTGVRRSSDANLPQLKIGSGTRDIHVELVLPSVSSDSCSLRLEVSGRTVWSQDHIRPFTSPDGSILIFEVPANALLQGEGRFVISQKSGPEIAYPFAIEKQ